MLELKYILKQKHNFNLISTKVSNNLKCTYNLHKHLKTSFNTKFMNLNKLVLKFINLIWISNTISNLVVVDAVQHVIVFVGIFWTFDRFSVNVQHQRVALLKREQVHYYSVYVGHFRAQRPQSVWHQLPSL